MTWKFDSTFEAQRTMLAGAISLCESPAEWMLACALFATSLSNGAYAFGLPKWGRRWELALQHPVGPYRVDIAVLNAPRLWAIEVDGHELHERAPEQVRRGNERQRDLTAGGWVVIRFSGSEVTRSPNDCARAVVRQLRTMAPATAQPKAQPNFQRFKSAMVDAIVRCPSILEDASVTDALRSVEAVLGVLAETVNVRPIRSTPVNADVEEARQVILQNCEKLARIRERNSASVDGLNETATLQAFEELARKKLGLTTRAVK